MGKPKGILKSCGKSFKLSSKIGKNKNSRTTRFSKATGCPKNKFSCNMTKKHSCIIPDNVFRRMRKNSKNSWIKKRAKTHWYAAEKRLRKAKEKKAENEYNNSLMGRINWYFNIIKEGGKTQKKNKKHKKYTKKHTKKHKKHTKKHKKHTKK